MKKYLLKSDKHGDIEGVTKALIYENINIQDTHGYTALMLAILEYRIEIVKLLINKGSNINLENNNGETALILACYQHNTNVALALIKTGKSNPEAEDESGKTAYDYAKKYKMVAVWQELAYLRRRPAVLIAFE